MEGNEISAEAIEHDETDGSYRVSLESCPGDSISMAAVSLVAAIEDISTADLDPLYGSVDPEALDSLHESLESAGGGHVTFPYAGYELTISPGALSARPLSE